MAEYEKKVRDKLIEHGCHFLRHGKGDHDIWYSPLTKLPITVDGERRYRKNGWVSIDKSKTLLIF